MRKRVKTEILSILCGMSEAAETILTRSQKAPLGREKRFETEDFSALKMLDLIWWLDKKGFKTTVDDGEKQDWNGSF